jgi:hypothetical protein
MPASETGRRLTLDWLRGTTARCTVPEKCPEVVDGGVEVHPKGNIGLGGFGLGDQFDAIDKLHARDHAGQ